jgi:hypothetical protein
MKRAISFLVLLAVSATAGPIQKHHASVAKKRAAAGDFEPSDLANLQLDINPELESGIDGSSKGTLTDQSGNGRTLTAAGSPNPTIEHGECNGKKVIHKSSSQWNYAMGSDYGLADWTLVVVSRQVDNGSVIFTGNNAGTSYVKTNRTGGNYWQVTTPSSHHNAFYRGLRSTTLYGSYMMVCSDTEVHGYYAGEIMPSTTGGKGPFVGTDSTMTFRSWMGGATNNDVYVARILLYDRALSQSECRQLAEYIETEYALGPQSLVVCEGNSWVSGGAIDPDLVTAHIDDVAVFNVGQAGDDIDAMVSDYAGEVEPLFSSYRPANILVAYEFTNELTGTANLAATKTKYSDYCTNAQGDGFAVVAVTPGAWYLSANAADCESAYQQLWTDMRTGGSFEWTGYSDALADPAALTQFDDLDDTLNATYYNADRLHLVAGGNALFAPVITTAVESLLP